MDFNATIDLIIRDLEDARGIIDDLKKYPGVPVLQAELAKAKCKSAAEVIALLKQEERTETEDRRPEKEVQSLKTEARRPESEEVILTPVKKEIITEQPNKKSAEGVTIGDSFSHLSSRFNEQLGNRKTDDDLSGILKTKPITSLTDAIGINDRFHFIREIFDGNKETYSQAISRLENATSIADAHAVIMSYTGKSEENEAVRQLLDLVKRKLPSNE
jgi:hypothetical protein